MGVSKMKILDGEELLQAIDEHEAKLLHLRPWWKKLFAINQPDYDLRPYWKRVLRIGKGNNYVPSTYRWW